MSKSREVLLVPISEMNRRIAEAEEARDLLWIKHAEAIRLEGIQMFENPMLALAARVALERRRGTKMLTKAERDEIRARADAATKGPWGWADWSLDDGPDRFTLQAPPETRASWETTKQFSPNLPNRLICDEDKEISLEDRAFISHARDDIPALLDDLDAQELEVARLTAERDRLIVIARADQWQARYWAEHNAVADREATIMAERAQAAAYRKALEPFALQVWRCKHRANSDICFISARGGSSAGGLTVDQVRTASGVLQSSDAGKALLDAHSAELARWKEQAALELERRKQEAADAFALRQRAEAAETRAICDGSTERTHMESTKAAIAALWETNPEIAYESPARVIAWLKGRAEAAEAALRQIVSRRTENMTEATYAYCCELAERALGGEGK